jgi:hypothetical protein
MIQRKLRQRTVLREFLDSVLYVAPVIVPRSRFATNDRSQEGGSVRRPGTYAKLFAECIRLRDGLIRTGLIMTRV